MDRVRETAFHILCRSFEGGAYSNLAMKVIQEGEFTRVDRAFATELCYGTISRSLSLQYIVGKFSSIPLKKISPKVLVLLEMGAYQILYMDRVPDSAACNTTVELARKYVGKTSGFVNAILRNIARGKENLPWPGEELSATQRLSIRHSWPEWQVAAWVEEFGAEFAADLLESGNSSPDLTLRTNLTRTTREQLVESLVASGAETRPGHLLPEAVLVDKVSDIGSLEAFKKGWFQVQDESAMLVAHVVDPQPGERILDCCAAPGGKTTHLAERMGGEGEILAWDVHAQKMKLIREAASRLGLRNITAAVQDAMILQEALQGTQDRVLVDAPCTGTGIVRRKPDIKWNRKPGDQAALVEIQGKILYNAGRYVKPGGVLVYSTCAMGRDENEAVVSRFLSENPDYRADNMADSIPEGLAQRENPEKGYVRLFPHRDGTDGFFISRMRRKEQE